MAFVTLQAKVATESQRSPSTQASSIHKPSCFTKLTTHCLPARDLLAVLLVVSRTQTIPNLNCSRVPVIHFDNVGALYNLAGILCICFPCVDRCPVTLGVRGRYQVRWW